MIWKGFDVILDEGGNFKYAVVKNKNKKEEPVEAPEENKEEENADSKSQEKTESKLKGKGKKAEKENLEVVEELPQEESKD